MRRLALCLLFAAVACGADDANDDNDTDNDPPGDQDTGPGTITVAVEPTAITLAEGSTGNFRITSVRTGALADAAVSYSVSDVPNGIGADIADDIVTLRVPYFTQNRDYALTVTATANGRKANGKVILTVGAPTPIDVRGRIVAFETGLPMAPATANQIEVAVWGRGATVPTIVHPTDDTFSFNGVAPPYDLSIKVDVTTPTRHLLIGLSRSDPTVTYYGYAPARPASTHQFHFEAADPDVVGYTNFAYGVFCDSGADAIGATDGGVSTTVSGPLGASATTCNAAAFAYQASVFYPTSYSMRHTASSSVVLGAGGTTELSFVASAASNQSVAATFTQAPTFTPVIDYRWLPDALRTVSYAQADVTTPLTELIVPGDAGLTTGVCLSAVTTPSALNPLNRGGTTACRLTSPGVASVDFGTLVAPANPGQPNGNVLANSVAFTTTAGLSGYVIDTVTAPQAEVIVFTNGQLTSQLMTRHGLPFLPSTSYQWQSFVLEGVTSVDALVSTDVTMHGFLTRQAGYTLSTTQGFEVH